jgi:hypothetical protein
MRRVLALSLLALILVLPACSKVTQANFNRVEEGMSYDQVVRILGQPSDSKSVGVGPLSGTSATWEGPEGTITIQFLNDKVKIKRFVSADRDRS